MSPWVANHYAGARPDRVRAIVMEDIDVARDDRHDFISPWGGVFPTREALEERIGARLAPYLRKSMKKVADGWTLSVEPREVLASQAALSGDYWQVWLSHTWPALVIRGEHSRLVDGKVLAEIARRRPDTELVTIDAGTRSTSTSHRSSWRRYGRNASFHRWPGVPGPPAPRLDDRGNRRATWVAVPWATRPDAP